MVSFLLGVLLGTHLLYWVVFMIQLYTYKSGFNDKNNFSVSAIICLKNEEEHVDRLVENLNKQDAEIIYVDDFSTDKTGELLSKKGCNVVIPDIDRLGKKAAISKGIQSSKSDYVLFTDADCEMSPAWSTQMISSVEGKDLLLGYGPMKKYKGLVPLFSRYETYQTAIQYFSYALAGQTYMGVGRNMMVKREQAITAIPHLLKSELSSGDDDMMVNFLAKRNNVAVTLERETFTYSDPKFNLKSFIKQKSRHISTSTTYKPIHQILLGGYSASFMGFYSLLILGTLIGYISFKTAFLYLLFKWFLQSIVNWKWMKKLDEFDLWWKFPALDLLMYLYLLILSPYLVFKNKSNWS